ncbi:MAG: ribonuclease P protein component [Anaerolineae bacterium]
MLAKQYRLTKAEDFRRVHSQGQSWANGKLVLCRYQNSLDYCRFGFSVSRKMGGAVVRNRIKRVLREVIRLNIDQIVPGWDVVFLARKGIVDATYWTAEQAMLGLMRSAKILNV